MAARPVRVFEVTVRNAQSTAALQEAMRQALVRATGRREAATDPALSNLIANAERFVQAYRPASGGATLIAFDATAVEQEILAAGRSVWEQNRPFTIVVLNPPLTGAAADAARQQLEEVAETRGLPVSLVPMNVVDSMGMELGRDALLRAAQRLGGDAVLLGRGSGMSTNGGVWQWTLHTPFASEEWTGGFDAGVHGAADAFARVSGDTMSFGESEALVQISNVRTLNEYALVGRLLESAPGVKRASLEETDGTTVVYRVLVRGGADALDQALSASSRLSPLGQANARLNYQLRP